MEEGSGGRDTKSCKMKCYVLTILNDEVSRNESQRSDLHNLNSISIEGVKVTAKDVLHYLAFSSQQFDVK